MHGGSVSRRRQRVWAVQAQVRPVSQILPVEGERVESRKSLPGVSGRMVRAVADATEAVQMGVALMLILFIGGLALVSLAMLNQ